MLKQGAQTEFPGLSPIPKPRWTPTPKLRLELLELAKLNPIPPGRIGTSLHISPQRGPPTLWIKAVLKHHRRRSTQDALLNPRQFKRSPPEQTRNLSRIHALQLRTNAQRAGRWTAGRVATGNANLCFGQANTTQALAWRIR